MASDEMVDKLYGPGMLHDSDRAMTTREAAHAALDAALAEHTALPECALRELIQAAIHEGVGDRVGAAIAHIEMLARANKAAGTSDDDESQPKSTSSCERE